MQCVALFGPVLDGYFLDRKRPRPEFCLRVGVQEGGGGAGLWGEHPPPPGGPELLEAPKVPKNFSA